MIGALVEFVLHLDRHLVALLARYDVWIYAILFTIIFCETGLVVTPFLPGDSLLFAIGALTAVDSSGALNLYVLLALLSCAAILGNTANYGIGRLIGARAFSGQYRFINVEYLRRTEQFFARHGGMAIVLSRFVPIVRTFAPFVAGVSRMNFARFQFFNVAGGLGWVVSLTVAGFIFGNLPVVKEHFGLVTILIIVVSLLPMVWVYWKERHGNA